MSMYIFFIKIKFSRIAVAHKLLIILRIKNTKRNPINPKLLLVNLFYCDIFFLNLNNNIGYR